MTVGTLIKITKGLYGLERSDTGDSLFTDAVMMDMANLGHHGFAAAARPYYKTITANLTLGTTGAYTASGTSVVPLDTTVIEVDIFSVRVGSAGGTSTWVGLPFKPLKEIVKTATGGALENTALQATPEVFFLRPGATDAEGRVIELYPGRSTGAVSNGLKYNAWVYGPDFTATSDVPELQPAEHYRLIPWIAHQMALLERSRGRQDAPVMEWRELALDVAIELYNILWRGHQGVPRTAEVGMSSGEDALLRRAATINRGGR